MKNNRIVYDFVAEVGCTPDVLTSKWQDELDNRGFSTQFLQDAISTCVSARKKPSLTKTLCGGIPETITWSIQIVSEKISRLSVYYGLSCGSRMKLYGVFAANILLFWIVLHLLVICCDSMMAQKAIYAVFGSPVVLLIMYLVIGGIGFGIVFVFIGILNRFKFFGRTVLGAIAQNMIVNETALFTGRSSIEPGAFLFFVTGYVLILFTLVGGYVAEALIRFKSVILPMLGLASFVIWHKLAQKSIRFQALYANFLVVFALVVALLFTPIAFVELFKPLAEANYMPAEKAMWYLWFLLFVWFFVFAITVAVIGYTGHLLRYFLIEAGGFHNRCINRSYVLHAVDSETGKDPLSLTSIEIILVWLLFVCSAWLCWKGVLLNSGILFAVAGADLQGGLFKDGFLAVLGLRNLITYINQGHNSFIFPTLIVMPVVLPFLCFTVMTIRFFFRRSRKLVTIAKKAVINSTVCSMAKEFGIDSVRCVLDERESRIMVVANFGGMLPDNQIVFSNRALAFLENNPLYVPAVLAHEMAHLKYDCKKLWIYTVLSRMGLVGAGFLSVLCDPLMMEDRADCTAIKYLEEHNIDGNLVAEAAVAMEASEHFARSATPVRLQPAGFKDSAPEEALGFKRVRNMLSLLYFIYFETDLYDYFHRPAHERTKNRLSCYE